MSYIKVEDVSRQFTKADGSVFQALDHVDLEIKQACKKKSIINFGMK